MKVNSLDSAQHHGSTGDTNSQRIEANTPVYSAPTKIAATLPNALERLESLISSCQYPAFFLDYDGTLAPIVANPERAFISEECREALRSLKEAYPVSIVSGRSCDKLRDFLKVDVVLAGSHGLDIQGIQLQGRDRQSGGERRSENSPERSDATRLVHPVAAAGRGLLNEASAKLAEALGHLSGYETEDNEFCISVHYRRVDPEHHETIHTTVQQVVSDTQGLLHRQGKMVHELRPDVPWDKGRAVAHLLSRLASLLSGPGGGADSPETEQGAPEGNVALRLCPIYLGDDVADEDALAFVESVGGIGIKVTDNSSAKTTTTTASLRLDGPHQVLTFLSRFVAAAEKKSS